VDADVQLADFAARLARFPRLGLAQLRRRWSAATPLRISRWATAVGQARGCGRVRLRWQQTGASSITFFKKRLTPKPTRWCRAGCTVEQSTPGCRRRGKTWTRMSLVVYQARVPRRRPTTKHRQRASGPSLRRPPASCCVERRPQHADPATRCALRAEGRNPYLVPYGVSNALGAVAYAAPRSRSRSSQARSF